MQHRCIQVMNYGVRLAFTSRSEDREDQLRQSTDCQNGFLQFWTLSTSSVVNAVIAPKINVQYFRTPSRSLRVVFNKNQKCCACSIQRIVYTFESATDSSESEVETRNTVSRNFRGGNKHARCST